MNRALNHRRDVALFRYMRATAHADQAKPHPPWITWRRSVCRVVYGPPVEPIQLGWDLGYEHGAMLLTLGDTTPAELEALKAEAIARLAAGLNRVMPLPEGHEFYWAFEDGGAK